jgi:hypothetical protein
MERGDASVMMRQPPRRGGHWLQQLHGPPRPQQLTTGDKQ